MAKRDTDPPWWTDEYTHNWDRARDALLRELRGARAPGAAAAVPRAEVDTTRQAPSGKLPRFPANQAGSSLLGGRHQQPVDIGLGMTDDGTMHLPFTRAPVTESGQTGGPKAAQGGFVPGLGEWTERELAFRYGYELAVRFGYGAARHFGQATWDERLERELERDWSRSKESAPWRDVREDVRRGFEAGRR